MKLRPESMLVIGSFDSWFLCALKNYVLLAKNRAAERFWISTVKVEFYFSPDKLSNVNHSQRAN